MSLFSLLRGPDVNRGVEEFRAVPGAVLLDVRERDEYSQGRIPGSVNLPLSELEAGAPALDKSTPLFVYCLSGGRSSRATAALKAMGFRVKNIGGISAWKGEIER